MRLIKLRPLRSGWHLFDRIALYRCAYLATVRREYWSGHYRSRLLKIGSFSLWMRNNPKGPF